MSTWHEKLGLLEAKVQWLEAELNELREESKPVEPERWRPEDNFIDELYRIKTQFYLSDESLIQYLLIKELARELNDGWVPNWSDLSQSKHVIYYDNPAKKWCAGGFWTIYNELYTTFKSREIAKRFVKILNRGDIDELVKEVCGD